MDNPKLFEKTPCVNGWHKQHNILRKKRFFCIIAELATKENNQRRDSIKPLIMITNHSYVFAIKKAKKIKKGWTLNSLSEQGKAERNKKDRFFERKKKD